MDHRSAGTLVIVVGALLLLLGILVRLGAFSWFGRLPGDVSYKGDHVWIFVPFASMILISLILTVALYLLGVLRRFW